MKKPNIFPAVLLLSALGTLPTATTQAAEHPRLVNIESAKCSICHEDLLENRSVVHAPVEDDCTTCHEMNVEESGTTVEMMDAEPSLCLMCHDELTKAVEIELEAPHFPVSDSCLNCHNPHASDNRRLLNASMPELCSDCHDLEDLNVAHGSQLTPATSCASCHNPHGSDNERMLVASSLHAPFEGGSCQGCHRVPFGERIRLRTRGERLCEACHGDITEGLAGSVHRPLKGDGRRPGCLSCHDPHMSEQSKLLIRGGNTLCAECHGEVVTAADSETGHFAAADDCTNCHLPHAAANAKLLTSQPDDLCGDCHDLEDEDLETSHLGANLSSLACTSCHSPHGAGHAKLLAKNLHAPVEDGCDTCHEGAYNDLMEGGPPELCLFCHDDIGEAAAAAEVPHAALEFGSCTDCHNPHAAAQEKLIKSPGAGPCADCHEDQVAGTDEVAHGVIDLLGCRACHEPHGGSRENLLRQSPSELCLSCHSRGTVQPSEDGDHAILLGHFRVPLEKAQAISQLPLSTDGKFNHPLQGHRVSGIPTEEELARTDTNFTGELTCLTCHNPHKGRSKQIFRWEAASSVEACINCHEK